ncbi:hypothetical protein ESCOCP340M_22205 [Escherichia coli]|nr:hypothetical protein [Escherichia coli]
MSMTTELAQRMKAAALKAIADEGQTWWSEEQLASDYGLVLHRADAKFIALASHQNVLALVEALEARDKQIAEMQTKDINVKRQAQALFDAIQNPDDAYIPAYVRCLRNALTGVAVEGENS